MKFNINVGGNFIKSLSQFTNYFDTSEIEIIQSMLTNNKLQNLVNKESIYLSHCDFQPTNLLRYQNHFHIVDWDASGIDHKFYDVVKFYLVHYRKPRLQSYFFKIALNRIGINQHENIILLLTLISRSIFECKVLFNLVNDKNKDNNQYVKDILSMRVKHVKMWLKQIKSLI